ncbi:MAG TPA: DUF4149 domain-containing protein [Candidatus Acidoferrales bacterium]|nr:DUF4149 domain-containing protein [Candidatus Acidoferrales bacterium]
MKTILRFLQVLALGVWLGALIYFAFVLAPTAFLSLPSQDLAGAFVGVTLGLLHQIGVAAALIFLAAAVGWGRSLRSLVRPAAICVWVMLALTLILQRGVIPRMDTLRTDMGSVAATSVQNPLRAKFDRLHGVSVELEGCVLLLGLAGLFLTVRERDPRQN